MSPDRLQSRTSLGDEFFSASCVDLPIVRHGEARVDLVKEEEGLCSEVQTRTTLICL